MATREVAAGDEAGIESMLLRTDNNGMSAYSEMVAEMGLVVPVAQLIADARDEIVAGTARGVVYATSGTTIRGCALFRRVVSQWELAWVAIDKTLNGQTRLVGFRDSMRDVASRVAPLTQFYGVTKTGGRLDLYLTPRLARRTEAAPRVLPDGSVIPMVRFDASAAEMLVALT